MIPQVHPSPLNPAVTAALTTLNPDPMAFWMWLQPQITEDMLVEIAEADYGEHREAHLAALRQLHAAGEVSTPQPWVPQEVLRLLSYSEPDYPAWKPRSPGVRGHLLRAFCTAALLRAGPESAQWGLAREEDLVHQLVASVLQLNRTGQLAVLQLLAWRVLHEPSDTEARPFFALGVLLLTTVLALDPEGTLLQTLCVWLEAEVANAHAQGCGRGWDVWLIGLVASSHDESWRQLVWQVLVEPADIHPPPARAALERIATRVICGTGSDGE